MMRYFSFQIEEMFILFVFSFFHLGFVTTNNLLNVIRSRRFLIFQYFFPMKICKLSKGT